MGGIIVIGIAFIWLSIAAKVARKIPIYLNIQRISWLASSVIFIVILIFPFADEIVGRVQYQKLCSRKENLWVHPDAAKVIAARKVPHEIINVDGVAIPIRKQVVEYVDATNGKPFFRVTAYHTPGGIMMRSGLNMGNSTRCWPDKWREQSKALKNNELLERGRKLP